MPKKSIRVQMYPETKKYLEQIAKEYNCLYGNKPNIGELLAQIHLGRLIVTKASINRQNKLDSFSISLRIEVPRYLKGTIAIISKKIAKHKGNITAIKTKSRDNFGILQVFLSLPQKLNLSTLVDELQNLKIQHLLEFNQKDELELIACDFEKIQDKKILDTFLKKKLISEIACVIGFQLIAEDKVGVLAKIAHQIAKARLLIYSASENIGDDIGEAKIKLFLYLRSTTESDIPEQIKKIDGVIKQLKKIEEVKEVKQLGVDSLD